MERIRRVIKMKKIPVINFIIIHVFLILFCTSSNGKPFEGIEYFNGYTVLWCVFMYQLVSFGFYSIWMWK